MGWDVTYQYIGERYDYDYDSTRKVKMGGLSVWDIGLSYPVTSHLTVRGKDSQPVRQRLRDSLWLPNCRTGIYLVWQRTAS